MINNVTLIGRLTADPEIRTTDSGKIVCRFSIAINYKKPDGSLYAEFYPCAAWAKLGQTIEKYFRKGDYIGISGKLSIKPYQTKHKDRANAATVIVNDFSFCGSDYSAGVRSETEPAEDDPLSVDADDDVPF